MHVLYFTSSNNHVHDYRFLTKLLERGHRVSFVYLVREGADFAIDGLEHHHLGYDRALGWPAPLKLLARIVLAIRFRRLVRRLRPDVVHAGWVPSVGLIAALVGYRPLLMMPWGSDVLLYPETGFIQRKIVQYALRRADAITVDALAVRDETARLAGCRPEQIVVFPWGIDLRLFHPDAAVRLRVRKKAGLEARRVIIVTRRLEDVAGVGDLIEAVPEIVRRAPDAQVLVCGEGSSRESLEQRVDALGVRERVRFFGKVCNEDLPEWLNAADLYATTSLSDGTSLSLLEAMACGLPVLTTDVPAILEWIQDGLNGAVAPRRDHGAIADRAVELLNDQETRHAMGERNLAIARERADWDKNFTRLEEMYDRLVGT